jgi:hypothetical protein
MYIRGELLYHVYKRGASVLCLCIYILTLFQKFYDGCNLETRHTDSTFMTLQHHNNSIGKL